MSRIEKRFAQLKADKRAGLVAYVTAGDPNPTVGYDILFRAAAETMLTIAADPKHLGATIGITAVLHTWGSAMTQHPHSGCPALSSP